MTTSNTTTNTTVQWHRSDCGRVRSKCGRWLIVPYDEYGGMVSYRMLDNGDYTDSRYRTQKKAKEHAQAIVDVWLAEHPHCECGVTLTPAETPHGRCLRCYESQTGDPMPMPDEDAATETITPAQSRWSIGDIYMGEAITSRTRCRGWDPGVGDSWERTEGGEDPNRKPLTVAEAYRLWRRATASNEWVRQARRAALYGEEVVLTDSTHGIEGLTLYLTATANNDLFRVAWSWGAVTAATDDSVNTTRLMMAREAVTG